VTLYAAIFYLLSAVTVAATAMAITRRQPVHSVLYLIVAFLGTAALFFLLGAPLLATFVVIIYAGAIMVLILFVIMLFRRPPRELKILSEWWFATLLGVVFLAVAVTVVFKDPNSGIVLQSAVAQPRDFGRFLFERYWLAVEIVSILLVVALVVIIQVGRRGSDGEGQGENVRPVRNPSRCDSKPSGASNLGGEERDNISNGVKEGHQ
jgi:NADH-quinone oxidoreductase subunit J